VDGRGVSICHAVPEARPHGAEVLEFDDRSVVALPAGLSRVRARDRLDMFRELRAALEPMPSRDDELRVVEREFRAAELVVRRVHQPGMMFPG